MYIDKMLIDSSNIEYPFGNELKSNVKPEHANLPSVKFFENKCCAVIVQLLLYNVLVKNFK